MDLKEMIGSLIKDVRNKQGITKEQLSDKRSNKEETFGHLTQLR